MSHNDTIYSGVSAHPAREVADELHHWRHGESPDFALLVGAVTTLAREVDALTSKVDGLTQIGPLARIGAEAELDAFERWKAEFSPDLPAPSEVNREFSRGWMKENPELFAQSFAEFVDRYAPGYAIKVKAPRPSVFQLVADARPPLGEPSAAQASAAHIAGDPSVRLATPEAQLELVYSGLAEIWRMAAQREPYDQDSRFGALLSIEARCRAMLESAGRLPG